MKNAKQTFKTAFATARKLREQAKGAAEFSPEHNRVFVSYRYETAVRYALGYPNIDSTTFRAAVSAALVVATEQLDRSRTPATLLQRFERRHDEPAFD